MILDQTDYDRGVKVIEDFLRTNDGIAYDLVPKFVITKFVKLVMDDLAHEWNKQNQPEDLTEAQAHESSNAVVVNDPPSNKQQTNDPAMGPLPGVKDY